MWISAKTDYACRALIELSLNWPNSTPLQLQQIAENQKVPVKFLTHILIHLKQLGYVESVRGKSGGYRLIKPPKDIRLSDLLGGLEGRENSSARGQADILKDVWAEVETAVTEGISRIDFENIVNRYRNKTKAIMFEI